MQLSIIFGMSRDVEEIVDSLVVWWTSLYDIPKWNLGFVC